jgi:antitoxin ParD1/3/4/toxin ParE1/3/4
MSLCRYTDEAKSDLDDIWSYIAYDNLNAANRWVDKLVDACEALARNPGMGHTQGPH